MTAPDAPDASNPSILPAEVTRLIVSSIPTLEALEIVLLLARDPGREWQARMIPPLLQPGITEASVEEYLGILVDHGIIARRSGPAYVFEPRSPELARAIEGLIVAYHQRPVTLIRTVHAGADLKNIRTFADAFRLRRDRR